VSTRIKAVVHHEGLWINGGLVRASRPQRKRLVKLLLDAGTPVKGLWADCDYKYIDPRIETGSRV
jgi:hypothetical protein